MSETLLPVTVAKHGEVDTGCYVPTAAEIATGCEAAREEWDEREHRKRAGKLSPARVELLPVRVLTKR